MKHLLTILILLSSCRVVETVTKIETIPIQTTPAIGQIDCVELMKGKTIELFSPVYVVNSETKDSVKAVSKIALIRDKEDSTKVNFVIDCPPVEATQTTTTNTVKAKVKLRDKLVFTSIGFCIGVILMGFLLKK
jgi:hypothetical protein